jgi:plasmid replication initiation protein
MNNKNELVAKSNRLIEASYRLTLVEQRVILLAITEARRTQTGLSEANELEIRAADYAETFNVPENHAYEQLKEAGGALFQRYVILRGTDPKTGKDDKLTVRWVSSVRYVDGAGTLYLNFAHRMVPYITRLEKEFTRYRLEKVANMSSPYAIRLYELLIQWGSVGEREIELGWLRKTLMLDKEYDRLGHFKERVINVALSQINQHSDLIANYTQRKAGRTVTHLIFKFQPKEAPKPEPAKVAKPKAKPPAKEDDELDESRAKAKAQVVEFLTGNEEFKRLYPNLPVEMEWHSEGIRNQFMGAFDEWRHVREKPHQRCVA